MSITVDTSRTVRVPTALFPALHHALEEMNPTHAAETLRRIGFGLGRDFYQALEARADTVHPGRPLPGISSDEFWELARDLFDELGWGQLRYEASSDGVGAVTATEWVEADVDRQASRPSCHVTTGLLSDLLGRVIDGDVAVLQVECPSQGNANCRFLIGGGETLRHVHRAMREGTDVENVLAEIRNGTPARD